MNDFTRVEMPDGSHVDMANATADAIRDGEVAPFTLFGLPVVWDSSVPLAEDALKAMGIKVVKDDEGRIVL